MKIKRIACFLLAFVLLCGALVACDDGKGGEIDGEENYDGTLASLDFGGATLDVCVSACQDKEVSFRPGNVYTKGPDNAATSEPIAKKVLARNKKVGEDLGITLNYTTVDLWYNDIMPYLEVLLAGDGSDAPDVFHNDVYAMSKALLSGYLWNVSDPGYDAKGNEVKSYFDFDSDCWYKDYMEGATYSKDKMYILAGDYNLDMIRYAWVFFVNINLWDASFGSLSEEDGWGFNTYESVCEYIEDTGDWFYDDMITLSTIAHNDAGGSTQGKTDVNDAQIGCVLNDNYYRMFFLCSGNSLYEWTKNGKTCAPGEGTPSFIGLNDIGDIVDVGNKVTEIYNTKGVLPRVDGVDGHVKLFMDGKAVMGMLYLGEMESDQMRGTSFQRGILPFPSYSTKAEITTMVHDQAEVDCILNNATSFAMASAFLQYVNEQSGDILNMYYEDVLKFKYNDSKGARDMIDVVYGTVTSPFHMLSDFLVYDAITDVQIKAKTLKETFRHDAINNRPSTYSGAYATSRDALQASLEAALAKFNALQ